MMVFFSSARRVPCSTTRRSKRVWGVLPLPSPDPQPDSRTFRAAVSWSTSTQLFHSKQHRFRRSSLVSSESVEVVNGLTIDLIVRTKLATAKQSTFNLLEPKHSS